MWPDTPPSPQVQKIQALVNKNAVKTNAFRFIKDLISYSPGAFVKVIALLVISGLMSGIGLLLIIPLLSILGISSESAGQGKIAGSDTLMSSVFLYIPHNLETILLFYIFLITVYAIFSRWREIAANRLGFEYVDHVRTDLYRAISQASWSYLQSKRRSDFIHALNHDIDRIATGVHYIFRMVVDGLFAIVYITVSLILSWQATLTILIIGALLLLLMRSYHSHAWKSGEDYSALGQKIFASSSDFLEGVRVAKSFSAEKNYLDEFNRITREKRSRIIDHIFNKTLAHQIFQIGGVITLSVMVYISIKALQLQVSDIIIISVVFSRLFPLLSSLQNHQLQLLNMLPAYQLVINLTLESTEHAEIASGVKSLNHVLPLEKCIDLENLCYSYSEETEYQALHDINSVIPAFQITAVTGPSGSGKSTLADILAGLLIPTQGRISMDSLELSERSQLRWRRSVAYVPQEIFLFNTSIRNNFLLTSPTATDKEIFAALGNASAQEIIDKLPNGLNTVVNNRGSRLSGGESQRIAIARALLKKPQLLILDEATSALDKDNEQAISALLRRLKNDLTIVLISHRGSMINVADKILRLSNGRLI